MSETESNTFEGEKSQVKTMSRSASALSVLVLALLVGASVFLIYGSEPKAERESAVRQAAMLVDVIPVERKTYTPLIAGLGTVTAAQDIELSPRVSGRVESVSDMFIPGGFAKEGDTLLTLDRADYEHSLLQQESALKQAESEWDLELGRQDVAERDYEVLGKEFKDQNPSLALRKPQLESARAALMSAQAARDQAKLDLDRTVIKAPFNAQILLRSANVGSEVNPGASVARLVGVDEYHVIVTVPLSKLKNIALPGPGEPGEPAEIRSRTVWPEGVVRDGTVRSIIGAIDNETRLARILVSVKDPLAHNEAAGKPALIIGSIVQTHLRGHTLNNVVRLDRKHVHQGDTVRVMKDDVLDIRKVTVAFRDADYAYVSDGLEAGDLVITSTITNTSNGTPLRTKGQ